MKDFLDVIHPNWSTTEYTQIDFNKGIKNKDVKNKMQVLRAYYSKHSGKAAGCFCFRGIVVIINWLKKEIISKNDL